MSIYIPGMEMPTDCSRWVVIYPDGKVDYSDKTDEWVTLDKVAIPVPPHGRLGDLDVLLQRAIPHGWSTPKWVSDIVIADAITIIPADENN